VQILLATPDHALLGAQALLLSLTMRPLRLNRRIEPRPLGKHPFALTVGRELVWLGLRNAVASRQEHPLKLASARLQRRRQADACLFEGRDLQQHAWRQACEIGHLRHRFEMSAAYCA
jgi:hypothetical protein